MAGMRQFDEAQALDSALDVFWRQGFGATTMQDLAQATGVLRGSLYNAYGDKETIFVKAFEMYRTQFVEAVRAALDKPSAELALSGFFEFTIKSMTKGVPSRGCISTKTAIDESARSEVIRDALRGLLDDVQQLVEKRLSVPEVRQRLTISPKDAARLVVTMTRGIVVVERVYQDPARLRALAASLIEVLISTAPGPRKKRA